MKNYIEPISTFGTLETFLPKIIKQDYTDESAKTTSRELMDKIYELYKEYNEYETRINMKPQAERINKLEQANNFMLNYFEYVISILKKHDMVCTARELQEAIYVTKNILGIK